MAKKSQAKAKAKSKSTAKHPSKLKVDSIASQSVSNEQEPYHPHDKFVKCAFKNKEIAIDFFAAHLADINFSRQMLEGFSLSNNEYKLPFMPTLANDIIYRGEIEKQNYYIVVEHQSSFDKKIVVRFFQYSAALLKEHIEQNHEGVPVFLGICLYHNTHSNHVPGYNHKTDLESHLIDGKEGKHAGRSQLKCEIKLVDLTDPRMDYDKIATHGHAAILELFLKDAHLSGDAFITQAKAHLTSDSYQRMPTYKFGEFKLALYEYILSLGERPPKELIKSLVEVVSDEEKIMETAAEELRKEGRLEGRLEGKREFVDKMISKGKNPAFIKNMFNLSDEEFEQLSPDSAGSPSSLKNRESSPEHGKLIQNMSSPSANDNLASGINGRITTTNPEACLVLPATRRSSRRAG